MKVERGSVLLNRKEKYASPLITSFGEIADKSTDVREGLLRKSDVCLIVRSNI
jgi:hypothetical protein